MTTLTLTTTLDAVNEMLSVIGESPVSTLETQGLSDVAIAKKIFANVSRLVQAKGWRFNTEADITLPLTVDGFIANPTNALRIESADKEVVERGPYLYDLEDKTFTFTETIDATVIYHLDFETLPEAARWYITIRAARVFQDRILGSDSLHAYTERDELDAFNTLREVEGDTGNYNIFSGSNDVLSAWDR